MVARTEEERDILREVGNIGGGNALTSLSMLLDRPLDLHVPSCQVVKHSEMGTLLGKPDSLYAGVSMTMTGTVDCVLVLLMNKQFARLVVDALDSDSQSFDIGALTDIQESALSEVGNIMGNSYVTALGALLDMRIDVSVPRIAVGDGQRVLEQFFSEHYTDLDRLLFINSSFKAEDKMLESYMLLCPTDDSLSAILEKLAF